MALNAASLCRNSSITIVLLLLLQATYAQYDFSKAEKWLKGNLNELGGRAVLVVFKDGRIVYNHAKTSCPASNGWSVNSSLKDRAKTRKN